MLLGEGQYSDLTAQTTYDPVVGALVAAVAIKAWKSLPVEGTGELLSKIVQGPTESYSAFKNRLLEASNRTLGDINSYLPAIKLLGYENANRSCQEVLRLRRNKNLDDFIRLWRGIVPPPVVGQVAASAPREVSAKFAFSVGTPGILEKTAQLLKSS